MRNNNVPRETLFIMTNVREMVADLTGIMHNRIVSRETKGVRNIEGIHLHGLSAELQRSEGRNRKRFLWNGR